MGSETRHRGNQRQSGQSEVPIRAIRGTPAIRCNPCNHRPMHYRCRPSTSSRPLICQPPHPRPPPCAYHPTPHPTHHHAHHTSLPPQEREQRLNSCRSAAREPDRSRSQIATHQLQLLVAAVHGDKAASAEPRDGMSGGGPGLSYTESNDASSVYPRPTYHPIAVTHVPSCCRHPRPTPSAPPLPHPIGATLTPPPRRHPPPTPSAPPLPHPIGATLTPPHRRHPHPTPSAPPLPHPIGAASLIAPHRHHPPCRARGAAAQRHRRRCGLCGMVRDQPVAAHQRGERGGKRGVGAARLR